MSDTPRTKQFNRNKILRYMFRNAPVSRAAIAEQTGMTPAAVTQIIAEFVAQGTIRDETGREQTAIPAAGRKRVLIDLAPDFSFGIGVELTDFHFIFSILNLKGETIQTIRFKPEKKHIETVTATVIETICRLTESARIDKKRIAGVGIAVPGHFNAKTGTIVTNHDFWGDFSAVKMEAALGLPVVCENNVRCMAVAQYYFNKESCPEDFAFFHIGRGMFCAVMARGSLFMGNNFVAGEIGHTIVQPDGILCDCGKHGCLQTYCSETAVLRKCACLYDGSGATLLKTLAPDAQSLTLDHVLTAYSAGDGGVRQIFTDMIRYLAITLSNLTILNNPEKIFLHARLFDNLTLKNELQYAVGRQLEFVEDETPPSFEILPYSPLRAAVGAAAHALDVFFVSPSQRIKPDISDTDQ